MKKKSRQSEHPQLYRALHPSPIGKTVVYLPDDYAAFGHSILIDATNSHGDKFKDGGYRPLRPGSRWLFKMPKALWLDEV